jgi:golgi-specific brefeldin A-resistance guanine nucleotide exchange factor 1
MAAIRALEALARGRTIDRLKHNIDEGAGFQAPTDNGALPYDPASVFLLETMVSIACQTTRYIEKLWYDGYLTLRLTF